MKVAYRALFSLVLLGLVHGAGAQESDSRDALVGTWTLATLERTDAADQPTRLPGPRGVLILDRAGNVFEFFSTTERDQPEIPSDPVKTLENFGGFWGTYTVDNDSGEIEFLAKDGISPAVQALGFTRRFELDHDQLILSSGDEPQAQGHARWTWYRMPPVENLSPVYREVAGFWEHVEERQVDTATGETQRPTHRAPSVIVYTPSGFVGVHFPRMGREAFAGAEPTPEEAQAAVRGYLGYFGTLGVYPGEVTHNLLSGISPATGSILRRYAEITGDELLVTLQSGAARATGTQPARATQVLLRRLSNADDMLPR